MFVVGVEGQQNAGEAAASVVGDNYTSAEC
jgi:hypothetical protein